MGYYLWHQLKSQKPWKKRLWDPQSNKWPTFYSHVNEPSLIEMSMKAYSLATFLKICCWILNERYRSECVLLLFFIQIWYWRKMSRTLEPWTTQVSPVASLSRMVWWYIYDDAFYFSTVPEMPITRTGSIYIYNVHIYTE